MRFDSINSLITIVENNIDKLQTSDKVTLIFQVLAKSLSDTNLKVILRTINGLEKFIPIFKSKLQQSVELILAGISALFISSNLSLKGKADQLICLLTNTLDGTVLAKAFIHEIIYGNIKSQGNMISKLCGIFNYNLEIVRKIRPEIIKNSIYKLMIKLLNDEKLETKPETKKLIETLHKMMGNDFINSMPKNKVEYFQTILTK